MRIPELLLTICRYKAKINIKFLTEELGFESYQETAQFIVDHGAQDALEQDNSSAEAVLLLNPAAALAIFETARQQAFKTVDIKGQI